MNSDAEDAAKRMSLILKIAPKNQKQRKDLNVRNVFKREIYMYDEVK